MTLLDILEALHPVIGMQIEQKALQLWNLTVLRDMDFRETIYRFDTRYYGLELLRRDYVSFVNYYDVCVRYLEVRGGQMYAFMLFFCLIFSFGGFIEASKNVLGID